jgi:hypothetical protein
VYQLPVHVLTYERGRELKVYPDPNGAEDTGFEIGDFVLDVTFLNPDPGEDGEWDYGIVFGPTDHGEDYRVFVNSDGEWLLQLDEDRRRDGKSSALRLESGEKNKIRLIVSDGRGTLFINDRYTSSFELRPFADARRFWLATTNLDGDDQAFLDLSVWALP